MDIRCFPMEEEVANYSSYGDHLAPSFAHAAILPHFKEATRCTLLSAGCRVKKLLVKTVKNDFKSMAEDLIYEEVSDLARLAIALNPVVGLNSQIIDNTVKVAARVVTTDVTPSPRGSARCPLLVHYTLLFCNNGDTIICCVVQNAIN
ncbi:hypothetical protein J6590_085534 [Homalodisca vitripennis]|nr:hypothetical protein J6590_085534 [Homalodisca vitripennis]